MARLFRLALPLALVLALSSPAGCDTWDVGRADAQLRTASQAAERAEELARAAEGTPEASRLRDAAEAIRLAVGEARAIRDSIEADRPRIEAAAKAGEAAASLVPVPFGSEAISALVGGAIAWIGTRRRAKAFSELVEAIDGAKAKVPQLAEGLKAAELAIKSGLDRSTIELVDRTRV